MCGRIQYHNSDACVKHIGQEFLTPIVYSKVALGSEVLFVGYPNDYYDTVNNLPLVRKGTLASMPNIDFRGKGAVVIDAQVFGGSSGSPVFVSWDGKYSLLGVISATTEGVTPSGFPAVLGLGLVIKQRHVQELIDHAVNTVKQAWEIATGRPRSSYHDARPSSPTRLQPSGVEWLGGVPEHWEVVQLGRMASSPRVPGVPRMTKFPMGYHVSGMRPLHDA